MDRSSQDSDLGCDFETRFGFSNLACLIDLKRQPRDKATLAVHECLAPDLQFGSHIMRGGLEFPGDLQVSFFLIGIDQTYDQIPFENRIEMQKPCSRNPIDNPLVGNRYILLRK